VKNLLGNELFKNIPVDLFQSLPVPEPHMMRLLYFPVGADFIFPLPIFAIFGIA
jgi:hypothetical protein